MFLQLVRTGGLIGSTVVGWHILDDANSDFITDSGSVNIADSQNTASIVISVRPDRTPEIDEVFQVQLTNISQVNDFIVDIFVVILRFNWRRQTMLAEYVSPTSISHFCVKRASQSI